MVLKTPETQQHGQHQIKSPDTCTVDGLIDLISHFFANNGQSVEPHHNNHSVTESPDKTCNEFELVKERLQASVFILRRLAVFMDQPMPSRTSLSSSSSQHIRIMWVKFRILSALTQLFLSSLFDQRLVKHVAGVISHPALPRLLSKITVDCQAEDLIVVTEAILNYYSQNQKQTDFIVVIDNEDNNNADKTAAKKTKTEHLLKRTEPLVTKILDDLACGDPITLLNAGIASIPHFVTAIRDGLFRERQRARRQRTQLLSPEKYVEIVDELFRTVSEREHGQQGGQQASEQQQSHLLLPLSPPPSVSSGAASLPLLHVLPDSTDEMCLRIRKTIACIDENGAKSDGSFGDLSSDLEEARNVDSPCLFRELYDYAAVFRNLIELISLERRIWQILHSKNDVDSSAASYDEENTFIPPFEELGTLPVQQGGQHRNSPREPHAESKVLANPQSTLIGGLDEEHTRDATPRQHRQETTSDFQLSQPTITNLFDDLLPMPPEANNKSLLNPEHDHLNPIKLGLGHPQQQDLGDGASDKEKQGRLRYSSLGQETRERGEGEGETEDSDVFPKDSFIITPFEASLRSLILKAHEEGNCFDGRLGPIVLTAIVNAFYTQRCGILAPTIGKVLRSKLNENQEGQKEARNPDTPEQSASNDGQRVYARRNRRVLNPQLALLNTASNSDLKNMLDNDGLDDDPFSLFGMAGRSAPSVSHTPLMNAVHKTNSETLVRALLFGIHNMSDVNSTSESDSLLCTVRDSDTEEDGDGEHTAKGNVTCSKGKAVQRYEDTDTLPLVSINDDSESRTPLMSSITREKYNIAKHIANHPLADLSGRRNRTGANAFKMAVQSGAFSLVQFMLKLSDEERRQKDKVGMGVVSETRNATLCIRHFLDLGVIDRIIDIESAADTNHKMMLLRGNFDFMELVRRRARAAESAPKHLPPPPMPPSFTSLCALAYSFVANTTDAVLLAYGADINVGKYHRAPFLQFVATHHHGDTSMLQFCADHGADINAVDAYGDSALDILIQQSYRFGGCDEHVGAWLLDNGCDIEGYWFSRSIFPSTHHASETKQSPSDHLTGEKGAAFDLIDLAELSSVLLSHAAHTNTQRDCDAKEDSISFTNKESPLTSTDVETLRIIAFRRAKSNHTTESEKASDGQHTDDGHSNADLGLTPFEKNAWSTFYWAQYNHQRQLKFNCEAKTFAIFTSKDENKSATSGSFSNCRNGLHDCRGDGSDGCPFVTPTSIVNTPFITALMLRRDRLAKLLIKRGCNINAKAHYCPDFVDLYLSPKIERRKRLRLAEEKQKMSQKDGDNTCLIASSDATLLDGFHDHHDPFLPCTFDSIQNIPHDALVIAECLEMPDVALMIREHPSFRWFRRKE